MARGLYRDWRNSNGLCNVSIRLLFILGLFGLTSSASAMTSMLEMYNSGRELDRSYIFQRCAGLGDALYAWGDRTGKPIGEVACSQAELSYFRANSGANAGQIEDILDAYLTDMQESYLSTAAFLSESLFLDMSICNRFLE